jgi:D-apionolactonase
MVSRAIALCGTESVDAPMLTLKAGNLTAEFDNGALRYVRYAGIEVLRAIAFLVRDENWGTFTPTIDDLEIDQSDRRFSVTYRATCTDAKRTLVYKSTITGRDDGSLDFEAVATPQTDVLTNRTGFIVLHPLDGVAGRPVKVLRVDGSETLSTFPETIDPMCPFKNLRALSHEFAPGAWATCTMEGDTFEMEDQRNWSDASYKTYVRPLTEPWPYVLPKGQLVEQKVSLTVSGKPPAAAPGGSDAVTVKIGEQLGVMPAIGIGVPANEAVYALEQRALVKQLSPQWLVCQIDLRQQHGRQEMMNFRSLSELTGAKVALEIITLGSLDPTAELESVAELVRATGIEPSAVAAFPAQDMVSVQPGVPWPDMPTFEATFAAARKAFPQAMIGGGMAAYFTELNRKRPPASPLDYVTHTTCPNVHAADDRSVMETIEALPYQITSTRTFMGDAIAYHIGPSQLGCRENPYGKATAPNPHNGRVCLCRIDPRQRGLFNAAWTLAYISACAGGKVDMVALGSTTGPFGHIYRPTDFEQPYFDDLDQPAVYPSFHVLAGLAQAAGKPLFSTTLSQQGKLAVLALSLNGKTQLWLANLTSNAVTAVIPSVDKTSGQIAQLDESGFGGLTTSPDHLETARIDLASGRVELDAYAVVRIEIDTPTG